MDATSFARRLRGQPANPGPHRLAEAKRFLEGAGPCPRRQLSARRLYEGVLHNLAEEEAIQREVRRRRKERERLASAVTRRTLFESVQQGSMTLAGKGLLKGVRILGLASSNQRRYTPEAVRNALKMYEGAKVNLNHPSRPGESRGVEARFGRLLNVRVASDGGLVGDLKYNPHHPFAKSVEWWAQNDPGAVGLSHNVLGAGRTDADGTCVVERIARVVSVDLVADPATTGGLF